MNVILQTLQDPCLCLGAFPIWQETSPEGKSTWSVFSPTYHLPTLVAERRERLLTPCSDPALSTVSWSWSSWGDSRSAVGARESERSHVNRLLPPCLSAEWWAGDTGEGARVLTWKMLWEACHGCLSADKMCRRYPCSAFRIKVTFPGGPASQGKLLPLFIERGQQQLDEGDWSNFSMWNSAAVFM